MRRIGILWWFGAIVLAVLAGYFVYRAVTTTTPSEIQLVEQQTAPVVVAAENLPPRRTLTAADLAIKDMPVGLIPAGAADSKEQVIGKMATAGIYAGEPVLIQKLVLPDVVTRDLALSVPQGKIIVAVPTSSELVANRLISPGDHVDLLATFGLQTSATQTGGAPQTWTESVALLQNLEVQAVILAPASPEKATPAPVIEVPAGGTPTPAVDKGGVFTNEVGRSQAIVLAVPAQDALAIRHVLDNGGIMDVALRSAGDGSYAETMPVDQGYMVDRYQIDLSR